MFQRLKKIALSLHGWRTESKTWHLIRTLNWKSQRNTIRRTPLIASDIHQVSGDYISTFSQPSLFLGEKKKTHIVSQRRRGEKTMKRKKKRPSKPIRSVCMEMKGVEKEHIQICWQSCQGSGLLKYYCHPPPTDRSSQWHHLHAIVGATAFLCEYLPLIMTCCLHVDKWLHTWIFYSSLITRILAHTVKLTFMQPEDQLCTHETIYNLDIFLYMIHCDMTSPIPLSERDLYSSTENPVAATLSPANWISNASALICSQKKLSAVPVLQYTLLYDMLGFSCRQYTWKSNTQRGVNWGISANMWISHSYRTEQALYAYSFIAGGFI